MEYRIEEGRYLIKSDQVPATTLVPHENLQEELRRAHEEISELKMLVALYEDQLARARGIPIGHS